MKKITNTQLGVLTYFLIRAFFVEICLNSLLEIAKQDSYISMIIGMIVGIIPLIGFYFLFNYEPSLNIFDKMYKLFGSIIGNIINLVLIILTFFLTIIIFSNLITFIYSQYLNKTPTLFISLIFITCIFYALTKGVNNTLRMCLVIFFFAIILYLISLFGTTTKIDIDNLKPFFTSNYLKGTFSYLAYNVLPLYLLLLIPKSNISHSKNTPKILIGFYILGSLSIIATAISILGIFGLKLSLLYEYPEFQVLKYVSLIGFSARIDSLLFIQWIFDMLIFVIYSLHFSVKGISHLTKIKERILNWILPIFLLICNEFIFSILFINQLSIHILVNIIFPIVIFVLLISILKLLFHKEKVVT